MGHELLNLEKEEDKKVKPSPKINEAFEEVSTIAQIVGGDFGMKVKIGEPGRGSFFNPEEVSISIDPEHLQKNRNEAKFVVAHEGGHRAISRSPMQIGVSKEIVSELYSKIGFGFIQNAIEDPADNDWFSKKFAGLKEYVKENYDQQFNSDDAILGTPEITEYAKKLGFMPKFAKFGSEIIRHWHQGRYANNLDPETTDALKESEVFVKESISSIPSSNINEEEVIKKAQKRFQINTEKIWPYVEKLLEKDLDQAKKAETLENIKQKLQSQKQNSSSKSQNKDKGGDDDSKESIDKKNESEQKQSGRSQEEMSSLKEGEKSQQESSSTKNTKQVSPDSFGGQLENAGLTEEDVEEIKRNFQNQKTGISSKGGNSIKNKEELEKKEDLINKLSKKLEDFLKNLPAEEQKEIEEKAKRKLEDLEDAINKSLDSKLNEEKVQNHKEQRQEEDFKNKKESEKNEYEQRKIEREKKLDEMRKSLMTPYEKYRSEVSGQIENLYSRLKRVLKPEDFGKEESGYSSGQNLDLVRVMQSDYDFNQKGKIWIREEQPEFRDYRFMNLIDMSGSMEGDPIKEVFKGFVVVGEAIDRLEDFNSEKIKVHQAIKGFHDKVFNYKDFNKRFSEELEEKLATIVDNTDGTTNTYKATIEALEDVNKNLGKTGNFLLTFTDGDPNSDIKEELKSLLKNGREERRKKKIRVGLIWLKNVSDRELKEKINEYGYDFGIVLETAKSRDDKNFSEKLGDVIEDIIENPQKY
ncbi:MAG: hypothetical protein WCG45_04075 [bacterium]